VCNFLMNPEDLSQHKCTGRLMLLHYLMSRFRGECLAVGSFDILALKYIKVNLLIKVNSRTMIYMATYNSSHWISVDIFGVSIILFAIKLYKFAEICKLVWCLFVWLIGFYGTPSQCRSYGAFKLYWRRKMSDTLPCII
jgi:hypothetical protein